MEPVKPLPSISTAPGRNRWRKPLIAVLVAGALGGGWMMLHTQDSKAVEKPATAKKADVLELAASDVLTVESRELRVTLPVSGTLTPLNQATVKSKVAADVQETLVPEGMFVARGHPVMRLDTADLQARVATQQAALDEARARLALAEKTRDSNQMLLKQKFISENAFDTAQSNVALAQAAVKSAASQLEIARRALEDSTVRAPIDGFISKRFLQAGEKAAPDTALFSIVNLKQMILEVPVPASEIPRVKPGQSVSFNVDGFASRRFTGKVARINPAAEASSRSMLVYIAVDNHDGALKGGMFAKGTITLEKSDPMPLVPVTALRQEGGGSAVYRVDGGKVVAQPVTLGLRNDDEGMVEVRSGLNAGSRILALKLDGVKPGASVKLPDAAAIAAKPVTAAAVGKG